MSYFVASDYAGLSGGRFSFYYGYEKTIDDEWCFVVSENDQEVARWPASILGNPQFNVEAGLMAGISKWLESL